jgi:hypothetical protein
LKRFYKIIVAMAFILMKFNASAQLRALPQSGIFFQEERKNILKADTQEGSKPGSKFILHNRKPVIPGASLYMNPLRPQPLEMDHYTRNFGFMCKKELQFEKSTRLPLRLRLGSLDHCRYLEGY